MQRFVVQRLIDWKNDDGHKPLVIRGARQVGKTTLVNQFGKSFDNYLYLNLDRERDCQLFDEEDTNTLIDRIHVHCRRRKTGGSTLLFIDEVQNSAQAIKMLRYFREDSPWLHVVAAGSLLEALLSRQATFPVGRVEYMAMRPCSFCEFLGGIGEEFDAQAIRALQADAIHERLMVHFMNYMLVGGMPEAVVRYAQRRDVLATNRVYGSLLNSYIDDVQKYARNQSQAAIIRHVLREGWSAASEAVVLNNFAGSNYRSREMGEALRVIEQALLMELAYPVTSAQQPLEPNHRRRPKLLWLDTGLVNYCAGIRGEIFNVSDIMSAWRGRAAEHIVAQELIAENDEFGVRRFYWTREKLDATAEVDFVFRHGNNIVPIEVKSGVNSHLRSLHQFMEIAPHDVAVRVWSGRYSIDHVKTPKGKAFRLVNLPFYYVGQLGRVLDTL